MHTTTVDVSGFSTPLDSLVIEKHLRGLKGVLEARRQLRLGDRDDPI
ncbi:hypothetical protein [Brevundimonas diminuta]|uniref:Uncharacterized protein n=1 Tax=Brevundimonas diminuta TaxID=293 RepID=A0A2X1CJ07_BREDI|nr:hypothetical protein [Brevundimonas diminuta]SPU46576.1 Uncharacterised protein [Brevundimonas diminuta]